MEKQWVKIKTPNQELEVELLDIFMLGGKQYFIYTKDETLPNENKILYVSILKTEGNIYSVEEINDENEYQQVLTYLGQVLREAIA